MRQSFGIKGFSLIELLIVMAILAVGLAIAVPSFMSFGQGKAVRSEARQLKNLLAKARMDAVRRHESLTVAIDPVNNRCTVSVTNGSVISTIDFRRAQLSTTLNNSQIVWDTKGMTSDFGLIELTGQTVKYGLYISAAGNVRIARL